MKCCKYFRKPKTLHSSFTRLSESILQKNCISTYTGSSKKSGSICINSFKYRYYKKKKLKLTILDFAPHVGNLNSGSNVEHFLMYQKRFVKCGVDYPFKFKFV